MQENKEKNGLPRPETVGGVKWGPALQIFSRVSGWIVGPIILALIAGKALDSHFGTKPWMFLTLTGIAFFISIFGIVRVVSKYMKDIDNK